MSFVKLVCHPSYRSIIKIEVEAEWCKIAEPAVMMSVVGLITAVM